MSVGPVGFFSSVAGTQLAQASGADSERTQQDSAVHGRAVEAGDKAERAAGVGRTEGEHEAADRDADGRRPWEIGGRPGDTQEPAAEPQAAPTEPPRSKDPSGERGRTLDLSG